MTLLEGDRTMPFHIDYIFHTFRYSLTYMHMYTIIYALT